MNQNLITHWIIGVFATLTWFWGDKVGIPPSAINLAAWIVPGLLAHALGQSVFKSASSSALPKEQMTPPVQPIIIPAAGPINVPHEPSIVAGPAVGGGAASERQS